MTADLIAPKNIYDHMSLHLGSFPDPRVLSLYVCVCVCF